MTLQLCRVLFLPKAGITDQEALWFLQSGGFQLSQQCSTEALPISITR